MNFGCAYNVFDALHFISSLEDVQKKPLIFFSYQETPKGEKRLSATSECSYYAELQHIISTQNLPKGRIFFTPDFLLISLGVLSSDLQWEQAGGQTFMALQGQKDIALYLQGFPLEFCRCFLFGFALRSWRFDKYHTKHRSLGTFGCEKIDIFAPGGEKMFHDFLQEDKPVVQGIHWARAMANEPGNTITPRTFVEKVKEFESLGLKVRVLDKSQMKDFGALLGVAKGSVEPPFLVHLSWEGSTEDPLVFVGKGVTFDSGGLSIKPSHGMEDMKMDKTGAVNVAALLRIAAERKIPRHVVGILALVENMPSGEAMRPGDVVTSLSGQTIEVLNTDAEGRLILADALTYVQEFYSHKIQSIVDIATLTGAVSVALGSVFAGIFSNEAGYELQDTLEDLGEHVGELLWPLPLHGAFNDAMNSSIADMKNIAGPGVGAGSSTAAQFLDRFVSRDIPWIHLDIAGVDHRKGDGPLCPKGASAFGVRLLWSYVMKKK